MSAPAGPYIVLHRVSDEQREAHAVALERSGRVGEAFQLRHSPPSVYSRWAYATLEEARDYAYDRCVGHSPTGRQREAVLEWDGRSTLVVPLPDGSEIVVDATTVRDMLLTCPEAGAYLPALEDGEELGVEDAVRAVNAAYNARSGTAAQEETR